MTNDSKVEGAINAVSGLIDKVPIYEDAIQPLAQEAGKALATVGKTVNAALMPLRGLVWGMEQIEAYVQSKVSKKLENVPPEEIGTPDPAVAGPAIESLRFTGHKEEFAELYANLLATSMDKKTAKTAHPGFVEIIRSMSGDEAKILSFLATVKVAPVVDIRRDLGGEKGGITLHPYVTTIGHDSGCDHQELKGAYLRNLERLGLIDIPRGHHLTAESAYDRILGDPAVIAIKEALGQVDGQRADFEKYYVTISELGSLFNEACVKSRDKI